MVAFEIPIPSSNSSQWILTPELNQRGHFPQLAAGLASELYKMGQFLTVEDSLSAAGGLQGASILAPLF